MTTRLLFCACLWLLANAASPAIAQGSAKDEPLVKAAFIYNFAKFTRWPESALGAPGAPLSLCIAGTDELADVLWQLSARMIRGHPVVLQTVKGVQVPGSCHMLYVASSEQKAHLDIIHAVRNQPILTVSELPGFSNAGGIIELYRKNERLQFFINADAARTAGLEISPSLLKLGVKKPE